MKRHQSGVALVLVLWVITLLSVIAGNFAFSMRGEAKIARNLISTAQAQALADAGVQKAWFELSKPPTDLQRWQANGVPHRFTMGDAVLTVNVQDETGKIDLNTASDALLQGLFKSVGLSEEASVALVDAVVDWRDADRLRRLHGAEEGDYRSAGKSYIPTNSPFETIDELQRVLGMSADLYRKLAPALTVHSKQAGVTTAVAPRAVLLAIPGVNPAMVEQYLAQRQSLLAAGQRALPFAGAGSFGVGATGLSTYTARCEVKMTDGTVFVRQAVARLAQDPKRPMTVLAWGEGESEQLTEN
ncbi:MAG: type II secretion system protein GspK [Rhodoferax sp.]|nr:type II secretion system protein GspK [Rhodoferax sp.]